MKSISLSCVAFVLFSLGAAQAQNGDRGRALEQQAYPQVLASPGLYQSGNECAPDRAEAAWGAGNKFLGYMCVRNPSHR